jgi:hypothetical protein
MGVLGLSELFRLVGDSCKLLLHFHPVHCTFSLPIDSQSGHVHVEASHPVSSAISNPCSLSLSFLLSHLLHDSIHTTAHANLPVWSSMLSPSEGGDASAARRGWRGPVPCHPWHRRLAHLPTTGDDEDDGGSTTTETHTASGDGIP